MESWQIFHYAREILPPGVLQRIYSREVNKVCPKNEKPANDQEIRPLNERTLYYWSANPAVAETRKNPIDRLRHLFRELNAAGYSHVVRAALDLLAEPISYRCVPIKAAKSDKGTLDGELTDCLVAVGKFAGAARESAVDGVFDRVEKERIFEIRRLIIKELDEAIDVMGFSSVNEGES